MERINLSNQKTIIRKGFIQMANLQTRKEEKIYCVKGMVSL